MIGASKFYYSETQSSIQYTRTPTGALALNELIAGKACWMPATLPRVHKKKTLILADWTARNWTPEKREAVIQALGELMDQGFSVGIWRDGHVSSMTQLSIRTDLEALRDLRPVSAHTVCEVAVKENELTLDQIQVIDDYWLNYILSETEVLSPRVFRTSELSHLGPQAVDDLVQILKTAKPALTKIIDDQFCIDSSGFNTHNRNIKSLFEQLGDVEIERHYTTVNLRNMKEPDSFLSALTEKPTAYDDASLNSEQFRLIESLDLSESKITVDTLNQFLAAAPLLRCLHLKGCYALDLSDALQLDTANLQHIEVLDIPGSKISVDTLNIILAAAPKLHTFIFGSDGDDFRTGELSFERGSLQALKSFDMVGGYISTGFINKFLAAAPKLRTLKTQRFGEDFDAFNLESEGLQELEVLDVSRGYIPVKILEKILATALKLHTLNLVGCSWYRHDQLNVDTASLLHLESLDVSNSKISVENMSKFLAATPMLRALNLAQCEKLDGELRLDTASLLHLESLDVSESNISVDNLNKLLAAAPKLRTLILYKSKSLDRALSLNTVSLLHLESLDVSDSNISVDNVNKLLVVAPKLRTLTLSYCDNLDGALYLHSNSLLHLESLALSSSNISVLNVNKFLAVTPKLRTLELNWCESLDGALNLDTGSLPYLELLSVLQSNISALSVNKLLAAAPRLHHCYLSSCKSLDGALHLETNSLSHLESLALSSSNISALNVNKFLAAAPKLRTLNLNSCHHLDGTLNLDIDSLPYLESLDVSDSNISVLNINKLMAAPPKLRTLSLAKCKSLDVAFSVDSDSFSRLESLDVSKSNISALNVNKLLARAPKLRKLNLEGCKSLEGGFSVDRDSFPHLESLYVSESNISVLNVSKLLAAAPNLCVLSLNQCMLLDGELNLEANSLPFLRTIDGWQFNISADNIKKILAAAPNLDQASKTSLTSILKSQNESIPNLPRWTGERAGQVNPVHDSKKYKDLKPRSLNEKFEFKGTNQTKNQDMMIEKLSQYLTLHNKHVAAIPKIQQGICDALAHYFLDLEQASWDEFVDLAQAWNGREAISEVLISHFEVLYTYVETYQMGPPVANKYYLGDGLKAYLDTKSPCILANPWHAIAIHPTRHGTWQVYDPNYVTGWLEVSQGELLKTLHHSLGHLIAVEGDRATHALGIHHPNKFMEHGGLLALCRFANAEAMLAELPRDYTYSEAALDGMLLRGTSGKPAWMRAMVSPHPAIRTLGASLKSQFEAMHVDAVTRLVKSMDALTPMQQHECMTQLTQFFRFESGGDREQDTALIHAIRASVSKNRYMKVFKTWDKTAEYAPNITSYAHDCLKKIYSKRLIELNSTQHLDTLRLHLEQQAVSTSRPVFYIDKPDDLICSAPWMKKNADGTGELCKGPGGSLYDFLQLNQDKAPLILVNYEQFDADDMVRFNGLLDKEPHADGTALPKDTMIIGLMNKNKSDCYQGSDFYSRFNRTEQCPLTPEHLDKVAPSRCVDVATLADGERAIINLYHAPDWEERLLGRWILDGDTLSFHEGELMQAIQTGKPIEIRQGLWGNRKFERFWQQILSGTVRHAGRQVHIPEHVHIIRPEAEDYTWDKRDTILAINDDVVHPGARVLNPSSLGDFFGRYEVQGDKLIKQPGWIEACSSEPSAHGASVLHVTVTRTLTDDAWAMLLDACTERGVPLSLHVAPGVVLPEAFGYSSKTRGEPRKLQLPVTGDACLASTDIDTTVAMLTQDTEQAYHVIDISECTSADLLVCLDGKLNQESLKFEFSQSERAVLTGLARNQNMILKGSFSPELLDALAPELLERQQTPGAGQLLLVVDDATDATAVSPIVATYAHAIRPEDKLACLDLNQATRDALEPYLEKEPLCKLQARCMYLKSHPTATNTQDAWLGMMHLSGHTHVETGRLDRAHSEEACAAFTTARKNAINEVLACSPYVFLTGLSGVGKSTFVETELCDPNSDTLYLTEHRIEAWASDTSNKRKILFLDEANFDAWGEFEGLFNTPPSILIDGVVHRLDEHHKVVFAGNPVSYGDERTLAPLFQRHGNAVLFNPLPPEVIYEKILKPVILDESVTDRILDVYDFVCSCSDTDVLISPRELQMMALLTQTRAQNYPEQSLDDIAEHFTYTLAKNLVPKKNRAQFDERFKPQNSLVMSPKETHASREFFTTPSRHALIQQLHDLMDLHAWRQSSGSSLNTQQKSGGLGGIIIEGAPGIGKSELVIHELISRGYTEEHDFTNPSTADHPFYRMPVSMPLQEKEALLMKAFDEGAVVMIDEINSSPMMERLLNDLLMGKNPRAIEGHVAKPGFMVIGTQNPVSMAGRRVASTALQRRLITTELPEYHVDEIKTILLAKGVSSLEAESMVEAYESNRAYAIRQNLSPVPNFRHVIDLADKHVKPLRPRVSTPETGLFAMAECLIQSMKQVFQLGREEEHKRDDESDIFHSGPKP
jgi:hypothetical protein